MQTTRAGARGHTGVIDIVDRRGSLGDSGARIGKKVMMTCRNGVWIRKNDYAEKYKPYPERLLAEEIRVP